MLKLEFESVPNAAGKCLFHVDQSFQLFLNYVGLVYAFFEETLDGLSEVRLGV